jgi:hypothetical protein
VARRPWLALLALLVALHLAVRIPLLWAPWWVDEGIGALCATQPLSEIPRLARSDFAPPLHGLLMSLWGEGLGLLGWGSDLPRSGIEWRTGGLGTYNALTIPLPDGGVLDTRFGPEMWSQWRIPPLWLLRLSTLMISVGLLLGAVALARRMTGSAAQAFAVGLLLAVSPHVARWDTVVRYMTPLSLAVLGVVAALWAIASAGSLRARWWLLPALMVATLAALMTHFMGALSALPPALWLLLVNGRARGRRTLGAAGAMLAALVLFLILWGPSMREQWSHTGPAAAPALASQRGWLNFFPLQPALPERLLVGLDGQSGVETIFPAWWLWGLAGALLIAAGGYLLRLAAREGDRADALILLWLFGPPALAVAIEAVRPNSVGMAWRHYMPEAVPAALLFVRGGDWLWRRLGRASGELGAQAARGL